MTADIPRSEKVRVGILASGSGTTAEKLIRDALQNDDTIYKPAVVISNNPDAGVFAKVDRLVHQHGASIAQYCINKHTHPDRIAGNPIEQTKSESDAIMRIMQQNRVGVILLLGYMRKVAGPLLDAYGGSHDSPATAAHMFNTHPGLLPETAGLYGIHIQEHVISQGHRIAGQTLHGVSSVYDDANLIVSENKIEVIDGETPDELFKRVQEVEKDTIALDVDELVRWKLKNRDFSSFNMRIR